MPTDTEVLGLVMWALIIGACFAIRWVCKRHVSRNQPKPSAKWEQDVPMAECFDEMEDDL